MAFMEILRARLADLGRKTKVRRQRNRHAGTHGIFELSALEQRLLLSTSIPYYSYDFEGGTPDTTGWSTSTIASANAIGGRSATQYLVGPSNLTLSSLPAHAGALVSFDVYALDQWSTGTRFTLSANGVSKMDVSLANNWTTGDDSTGTVSSTSNTQSFPAAYNNAANPAQTGAVATGDLNSDGLAVTSYDSCTVRTDDGSDSDDCGCGGCGADDDPGGDDGDETYTTTYTPVYGNIADSVYHFTVPIDDAGSTLELDFGTTGGSGTFGLGIDNVSVDLATPEPSGGTPDANGVDLYTGKLDPPIDGLDSAGFGIPVDSSAAWGNGDSANLNGGAVGANTVVNDFPALLKDPASGGLVGQNGDNLEWFTSTGTNTWADTYSGLDTITDDTTNSQYIINTDSGIQATFYDDSGALPGQIKTETDPDGHTLTYNYTSGQLISVVNSQTDGSVHTNQEFLYSYLTSGVNSGKVQTAKLEGETWIDPNSAPGYSPIRETDYTYYTSTTNDGSGGGGAGHGVGNAGDLQLAQTKDGGGNILDSQYFRYYISGDLDSGGYAGAVKFVLDDDSYSRLAGSLTGGTTPQTATNTQVAAYADDYYQYDSQQRVSSVFTAADGSISYSYAASLTSGNDFNTWVKKTSTTDAAATETTTDYFNAEGQQMLAVVSDGTHYWGTFTHYNSDDKPDMTADPAAVNIPNLSTIEAFPDLLDNVSGNYYYLNDSAGEVSTTTYYGTTTANSTTAGGVAGMVEDTYIKNGETGTAIHQSHSTYYEFTSGSKVLDKVAAATTYGDDAGTDARTVSYAYSFYGSTLQIEQTTTTQPTISSGQNGPGSADVSYTVDNTDGNPIWTMDGDGHVNYNAYDVATGATIKTITDVNYSSLTSAEQAIFPSGWTHPSGGLHLVTTYEVDSLGRTTETTSPGGEVTYTIYNDLNNEVRTYSGWTTASGTATSSGSTTTIVCTSLTGGAGSYVGQSIVITSGTDSGQQTTVSAWDPSTHTLTLTSALTSATTTSTHFIVAGQTGAISVTRQHRESGTGDLNYSESLTLATPAHLDSTTGQPDGTETIDASTIARLSRTFTNPAGQTLWTDQYFLLPTSSGYSTTVALSGGVPDDWGTLGTNYYRTTNGYDVDGRNNYTMSATGTINISVYDALGRVISKYTGLDASHSGAAWTPSTNTGNMIKTEDDVYDGVGDGNVTQVTLHVDTSSGDDRVTQSLYDWRNRQIVSKGGVLTTEDTTTHRPLTFKVYDNAGEVTETDTYDGDGVALSSLAGSVPTAPSSSLLRAKSTSSYDEQGREYESKTYGVDQSSGTVGLALTTDTFRDHRGEVIATFAPGGEVSKSVFDGAGRVITQYTTDGGAVNNSGAQQIDWTHAGSVSSDVVLEETDTTFDADGNSILVTTKERFHDDASSSQGALGTPTSGIHARVSYMASYYDAANRETDSVNVGTNGGSSYTRPSSVPSSSDTVLVNHTAYDGAGDVFVVIDPRGIKTEYQYDLLGNKTAEIDNSSVTTPLTYTSETQYTYDGAGHMLTMTAVIPGGTNQTTAYVYGVGGTAGTNLFSNDLIAKTEFPDPSTGAASTSASNDVSNTYDLQGDIVTMKDQNGTTHTYAFDLLGRQISDSITVASGNPENIDTSIVKHATSYTDLGLVYQQTSLNSSSVVVNQLQYAYDGFGQQTVEYEEHSGAVNTSTSNLYQHYYAEGAGNSDRLLGFGYNSGRIIDYVYGGQFAISSITHSGTTATVTTDTPHGLLVGTKVTISGASPSAYDGTFTITAVTDATHFTYTTATTPGSNASGGAMLGTGTPQLPISSITHSGTTATITLPSGLLSGLSTGATFSAEISGATPSVYDGTFTVTVASSTSLTYTTSTTPSSSAAGVDIVMLSPTMTLDSAISRPDGIIDDTGGTAGDVLEGYSYLGLNTIVIRNRPEEQSQLTYVQQTGDTLYSSDGGDEYTGLDRFGRIIDQYWLDFGTGAALDRLQYAYDRNGNVLYENNLLSSAYSQLYHANSAVSGDNNAAYDNLNRLIDFQMGTLSSSGNNGSGLDKITSPSQTESFTLDGVGNWSDFNDSTTSDQTAAFNARNQYTSLSGGTATATPTYDYDGNMVTDQAGLHYKYDAWNQLVVLKASNNTTVLLTLAENALGQIFNYNDGVNAGQWNYDGNQVISYLTNAWSQMVWGLGYTNDLILRDRDADNNLSTGTYGYGTGQEERIYVQQDANYNVTSLYNLSTSGITERLVYDPYGKSTTLTAAWGAQTDTTILWKYRFQGTDFESAGGFNVMGARLQSVALGRWLQEDPSGYRGSMDLYTSFNVNPVNNGDPTGLVSLTLHGSPIGLANKKPDVLFNVWLTNLAPGAEYVQTVDTFQGVENMGRWPKPVEEKRIDYIHTAPVLFQNPAVNNPAVDLANSGLPPSLVPLLPQLPIEKYDSADTWSDYQSRWWNSSEIEGFSSFTICSLYQIRPGFIRPGVNYLQGVAFPWDTTHPFQANAAGPGGMRGMGMASGGAIYSYDWGYEYHNTNYVPVFQFLPLTNPNKVSESLYIDIWPGYSYFYLNGQKSAPELGNMYTKF